MKITKIFSEFFESEKSGGIILVICAILSLILANSQFSQSYNSLWNFQFQGHSIAHWINDGLMAIFFLLIGLELEREIYVGELSNLRESLLPIFGALGGVLLPAGIYLFFNYGTPTQSGAGIPMATDIAFALGVLSLLGNVPFALKVFLTALAVIDDLIAILVIAIFYTGDLSVANLFLAIGIFAILLLFNFFKIRLLIIYLIGGAFMWYFMLGSGVHATIAGVMLAFAIPFDDGEDSSLSYKLQHFLHKPVAFIILPLFALANTAITLNVSPKDILTQNYAFGIALGLILGKPLGIFSFSYLSVKSGLCKLPADISWKLIAGVGSLAGIGFTMSIFITLLAFEDHLLIDNAKLVIMVSSFLSGIIGFTMLKALLPKK